MSQNSKPLVSVIIPVYNTENYLNDCIESLKAQTLKDVEYIFINDKSTDNSVSYIKNFLEESSGNVRLINLKKKRYLGGVRNKGLEAASADVIAFCDSDDFMHPSMLEKMYSKILETESDMVIANAFKVDEDTSFSDVLFNKYEVYIPLENELLRWDGVNLPPEGVNDMIVYQRDFWSCMIQKKLLIENNISWPQARYEDNYAYSLLSASLNRVAFVNEGLYFYRQRHNSISNQRNAIYQIRDRVAVEKALLKEVKKRSQFEPHHEAWEYNYIFRYAENTIYMALTYFDSVPYNQIKEIVRDLNQQFPKWRKNTYWRTIKQSKERMLALGMFYAPKFIHGLMKIRKL